ncbi:MAG: flagellar basal-body MS-ring/collar protein FliF [Cellulosilyticaceae bacterium]
MQETITQVSTQLTDKWQAMEKPQKTKLSVGIGAIIIAIVMGAIILSKPTMKVVHRNLDLKQVSQVTEVLDNEKIPYRLIDEGKTVQVDSKYYNQAKILLARENVPKGKYTFDDAVTNSMSTTEDEKRAKMDEYKKAEIEKAIESIEAVDQANVTLHIPKEKNSFIASTQESSASVILTLKEELNSKQVEGIARFLSSSVEKLDMKSITILDTQGNNLYIGGEEEIFSASKQQDLKIAAEKAVHTKINNLLEPLYDEVRISPNLVLDFNQHEEVREEYLRPEDEGNRGMIQSENTMNTSSKNMQGGAEPGVVNNGGEAPGYQVGGNAAGESKSTTKNIQYANDKVVSNAVKNLGDIDYSNSSLAVNVFKNKIYSQELVEPTLSDQMSWEQFKQENKYEMPITVDESVTESIRKGTGIENVVVYGFEKPVFIDQAVYQINYKDYVPYVMILVTLGVMVVAIMKFRQPDELIETEPELEIEEMLKMAKEEVVLEDISFKENLETKQRIEKFVDEKPEAVASLLRNWLTQEDWE